MSWTARIHWLIGRQNGGRRRAYLEVDVFGWFTPLQARRLAARLIKQADAAEVGWRQAKIVTRRLEKT